MSALHTGYGINVSHLDDAVLAHLRDLGLIRARMTVLWPRWQRNDEAYRDAIRETLWRAEAAGIQMLLVLHNWDAREPVFRAEPSEEMWLNFAEWAAEIATLPGIHALQLWNEQDMWWQAPFGAGQNADGYEIGMRYARQLELAYPRIKAANPACLVISGGVADAPGPQWLRFLCGLSDAQPPVDGIGVHAYGLWDRVSDRLERAAHEVQGLAPLWLTEFGTDKPDASLDYQAACWHGTLHGLAREHPAAMAYGYSLLTDPADPGHGLFHLDGTPREAYHVLKQFISEDR